MTWLNALLAFALAMIVFCTMVSAITEFVQHILARRQQGLKWMLERFYVDVLRPQVASLPAGERVTNEELETFVYSLTRNLAARRGLSSRWGRRTELRIEELIERLPETAIGQALLRKVDGLGGLTSAAGQSELERVTNQVKEQFARYEGDATAYFGQRAQTLSVVVAIGLALCLNIDAVRLFSTFLTDQELTAHFLKEADRLTAKERSAAQAKTDLSTKNATELPTLDSELAALKEQMRAASALGLPVGLRYFPFCISDAPTDPACAITEPGQLNWLWMKWLVATLLAGALIGLGGPFWFDVFSKLSQMMDVVRAPTADTSGRTASSGGPAGATTPTAVDLTQRFVSAANRVRPTH